MYQSLLLFLKVHDSNQLNDENVTYMHIYYKLKVKIWEELSQSKINRLQCICLVAALEKKIVLFLKIIFNLDQFPVTIQLPNPFKRILSCQKKFYDILVSLAIIPF